MRQPLEQVGASLVAHAKAAAAKQPRERTFDHPPVSTEPLAGVDPTPGDPGSDTPGTHCTAKNWIVIGIVGVELGRALAWPL